MPPSKTYTFQPVPQQEADAIRRGATVDAPWFSALLNGTMLLMPERPSITKAQNAVLDEKTLRVRTRSADERGVYLWVEPKPEPKPKTPKALEEEPDPLSLVS